MRIVDEMEKCEKELSRALDIHPLSKTLLRERANLMWNIRKTESKTAYEKVLVVINTKLRIVYFLFHRRLLC